MAGQVDYLITGRGGFFLDSSVLPATGGSAQTQDTILLSRLPGEVIVIS